MGVKTGLRLHLVFILVRSAVRHGLDGEENTGYVPTAVSHQSHECTIYIFLLSTWNTYVMENHSCDVCASGSGWEEEKEYNSRSDRKSVVDMQHIWTSVSLVISCLKYT